MSHWTRLALANRLDWPHNSPTTRVVSSARREGYQGDLAALCFFCGGRTFLSWKTYEGISRATESGDNPLMVRLMIAFTFGKRKKRGRMSILRCIS